jgi:hypothetical protein
MSLKQAIPWWGKIAVKLFISRIPVTYRLWKRLSLFEHGSMEQPAYAYQVFQQHYERAQPDANFVSLELGPGDSLCSAIISKVCGGSHTYLVDVGSYASYNLQLYQHM